MANKQMMTGQTYHVRIDGEWTVQDRMFTRGDMTFWGFSLVDVQPPTGYVIDLDAHGEPMFRAIDSFPRNS